MPLLQDKPGEGDPACPSGSIAIFSSLGVAQAILLSAFRYAITEGTARCSISLLCYLQVATVAELRGFAPTSPMAQRAN